MPTEQESFWNTGSFAVITDKTKPAMKWTIEELIKRGKKVHVVDMSAKPDKGTVQKISELPSDVDRAVMGVTKVKKLYEESQIQCITGRCPMMYLGHGFNMHTMHRGFAKLIGKY